MPTPLKGARRMAHLSQCFATYTLQDYKGNCGHNVLQLIPLQGKLWSQCFATYTSQDYKGNCGLNSKYYKAHRLTIP